MIANQFVPLQRMDNFPGSIHFNSEQDWKIFRQDKVGASDIACLMGRTHYKNKDQLLEEKRTGVVNASNYVKNVIFERGKQAEDPTLLEIFDVIKESEIGGMFDSAKIQSIYFCQQPCFCIDDKYMVTLDAILKIYYTKKNEDKTAIIVIETKNVNLKDQDLFDRYCYQMYWQKYVFEEKMRREGLYKEATFHYILANKHPREATLSLYFFVDASDNEREVIFSSINRFFCVPTDKEILVKAADEFLEELRNGKPKKEKRSEILGVSDSIEKAYLQAKAKLKQAEEELKLAEEQLLANTDPTTSYYGKWLTITRTPIQGRINYEKIPALSCVNLNEYRGNASYRTTIKEREQF